MIFLDEEEFLFSLGNKKLTYNEFKVKFKTFKDITSYEENGVFTLYKKYCNIIEDLNNNIR